MEGVRWPPLAIEGVANEPLPSSVFNKNGKGVRWPPLAIEGVANEPPLKCMLLKIVGGGKTLVQ